MAFLREIRRFWSKVGGGIVLADAPNQDFQLPQQSLLWYI
jgi:hypothetical protein